MVLLQLLYFSLYDLRNILNYTTPFLLKTTQFYMWELNKREII